MHLSGEGDAPLSDRWRPGPVHEAAALAIADEIDERIYEGMYDMGWMVPGFGGVAVMNPATPGPSEWPLSLVDDLGRRYELTVEVSVRPSPPRGADTRE